MCLQHSPLPSHGFAPPALSGMPQVAFPQQWQHPKTAQMENFRDLLKPLPDLLLFPQPGGVSQCCFGHCGRHPSAKFRRHGETALSLHHSSRKWHSAGGRAGAEAKYPADFVSYLALQMALSLFPGESILQASYCASRSPSVRSRAVALAVMSAILSSTSPLLSTMMQGREEKRVSPSLASSSQAVRRRSPPMSL